MSNRGNVVYFWTFYIKLFAFSVFVFDIVQRFYNLFLVGDRMKNNSLDIKYSLDMLRLEYKVKTSDLQRLLDSLQYRTDCDYWECTRYFSYRHQFTFRTDLKNSYTLLADFNGAKKTDNKIVILEFNPNKVGKDLGLLSLLGKIYSMSYKGRIVRFDCAIDIPVPRDRCFLMKDQRTYSEYKNSSSDYTQYLGHRNAHGFVKLYNKAKELKLPVDNLTRLELTIDGDKTNQFPLLFPKVYILNNFQVDEGFLSLSDTDKVLVLACMDNPKYLDMLGRKKGKKIKEFIAVNSFIPSPDYACFSSVCSLASGYLHCSLDIIDKYL